MQVEQLRLGQMRGIKTIFTFIEEPVHDLNGVGQVGHSLSQFVESAFFPLSICSLCHADLSTSTLETKFGQRFVFSYSPRHVPIAPRSSSVTGHPRKYCLYGKVWSLHLADAHKCIPHQATTSKQMIRKTYISSRFILLLDSRSPAFLIISIGRIAWPRSLLSCRRFFHLVVVASMGKSTE